MSTERASRPDRLAERVAAEDLDALIVGDLVNPGDSSRDAGADVFWLTGFAGTSALALVGSGVRAFVTDFRYIERARDVLDGSWELVRAERHLSSALAPHLGGRVGYDPRATSVRELERLSESVPSGGELVECDGLVSSLRRRKDAGEVERIAAATELSDAVLTELEQLGVAGRSERELALWIERRSRELGASAVSFPPIVAAGENGALPHAEPGEREIREGELLVVDAGAILDGYCSDGTRTYAVGREPGEEERGVYAAVLAAQQAGLEAVAAGVAGRAADGAAREVIAEAGWGKEFGHGLGHGVGIAVHEPPRLSQRSEDVLAVGDVVTIEPGVYLPGRFGVRIEDLVVVGEDGVRNLSSCPKELRVIA